MIILKTKEELEALRKSGKVLAAIVKEIRDFIKVGATTQEIDKRVEALITKYDARPAFKGYRGYPACTCISLNEEVVHGIPNGRMIQEGDIASIDVGIVLDGFFSDTAFSVGIGKVAKDLQKLMEVTRESLFKGIEQAKVNNHLSDISAAIQNLVEKNNFSVVRDFVGHGIGRALHEDPEVPNFGLAHCEIGRAHV